MERREEEGEQRREGRGEEEGRENEKDVESSVNAVTLVTVLPVYVMKVLMYDITGFV